MKEKFEALKARIEDFVESNPEVTLAICYVVGAVAALPLTIYTCKVCGEAQGRGLAKGLLKEAGVVLDYPTR